MATRGKRQTSWYAASLTPLTITGAGTGETTLISTSDGADAPPPGSTLLRIVGNITCTTTRSTVFGSTSSPQNAIIRVGLMVANLREGAACETSDLDDEDVLDDERWLYVATRFHRVTSVGQAYWNGAAEVIRYAHPDAQAHPIWDIDIRAKRRWDDPARLCLHCTWIGEFTAITLRPALRALFAMH